ncbi:MAG: hypothetical protein ACQR33_02580 [Candidatus Saccharibacteria bacterium]
MPDKQTPRPKFTATVVPALPSAFTLYRSSIETLLRNVWTFVLLLVVPAIVTMSGSTLNYINDNRHGNTPIMAHIGIGLIILGIVLGIVALPALLITQVKSAKQEIIEVDEALRKGFGIFWRYFGLIICLGFIYVFSFIALIVPFFFAVRRYLLAPYYLADQNVGIREALRRSAADSQNFARPIWGLVGVQVLNGLLASAPVIGWAIDAAYYCAPAVRYQQIQEAAHQLAEINKKFTEQPKK